ncbi:MAG TPA: CDP-glycerol glycerophosphotransferase family protein [Gaiellaceae bacterium]|nr:CDP-glycerol glycerophosphotransferase family protein [Gaiellaceae bacterium]
MRRNGHRRRSVVVFDSFGGKYSDSPRAVSEALFRREAPIEHVWGIGRNAGPVPAYVTAVPPGSPRHLAALREADAIVGNDVLPYAFAKAPGATYLQTWHGTPLKRIAFDVPRPSFPGSKRHYEVDLGRDVARWDVLLSPNRFSTAILPNAFRYGGELAETGYPRNDLLLAPERDEIRDRVRARLGIGDGVTAALYLPTWRDGDYWSLALDPHAIRETLGGSCVLLVRAHGLLAATGAPVEAHPSVRNVTDYQDLRELYLAADALVTDYSSAMFDFAVTGKPIVFYVYDLERYRDELRGFYFDLVGEAPGPLVRTSEEVAAALGDLDAVARRHAGAYARFRDRFCHLDDGRASERVADLLLERLEESPPRRERAGFSPAAT